MIFNIFIKSLIVLRRTKRNLHSHNEKAAISTNLLQVCGYGEVSSL